jgi:hypothetical protein
VYAWPCACLLLREPAKLARLTHPAHPERSQDPETIGARLGAPGPPPPTHPPGPGGGGPSDSAISLTIAAAQYGRRVYYGTLADLITSLEDAQASGKLQSGATSMALPSSPRTRASRTGARSLETRSRPLLSSTGSCATATSSTSEAAATGRASTPSSGRFSTATRARDPPPSPPGTEEKGDQDELKPVTPGRVSDFRPPDVSDFRPALTGPKQSESRLSHPTMVPR